MVTLGSDYSDPSNYINANFISTVVKDYSFIATQGPLTTTVTNFWKMIEQNDVGIIMMFCNLEEKNKVKCFKYWPSKEVEGGVLGLGNNFEVEFMDDCEVKENLILRRFRVRREGKTKVVKQYQVRVGVFSGRRGVITPLPRRRITSIWIIF